MFKSVCDRRRMTHETYNVRQKTSDSLFDLIVTAPFWSIYYFQSLASVNKDTERQTVGQKLETEYICGFEIYGYQGISKANVGTCK